tara:strand:- start:88 stop:519 length:432 start_codon:yes stop_codon:yes gene_type:complete
MIQVSMVPKQYVPTCWPMIEPFLEKAAKYTYGRYTVDDIYDSIVDYDYELWVAFEDNEIKGAVVTNSVTYPKRKLLCMSFCGGVGLKDWKDPMLAILQRYARDTGCDGIEATARRGWAKVFQLDGYKSNWVTFELPIEGVRHG